MGGKCGKSSSSKNSLMTSRKYTLTSETLNKITEFEVISPGKFYNTLAMDQNSKLMAKGKASDFEVFFIREEGEDSIRFIGQSTSIVPTNFFNRVEELSKLLKSMMDFKNVLFIADKVLYSNKGKVNRLDEKFEKILGILEENGTYLKSLTLVGGKVSSLFGVFKKGIEEHRMFSPLCLFSPLDKPFYNSEVKGKQDSTNGCLFAMRAAIFAECLIKGKNELFGNLKLHTVRL